MLLILLTAVALRLILLLEAPPGLTHDEADHGITAWQIVQGAREIYFTIGYGREPLFDYATAVLMRFVGPTILAGRVTAVFFSLITLAALAAWVRRAFDTNTALLTAAGMAVAFWPLMSARQMLRSVTLPALFVLALLLFWRGLERTARPQNGTRLAAVWPFAAAGILLGLSFYTYMPARAMWLVFPLAAGYFWNWQRRSAFAHKINRLGRRVGMLLLLMLLTAAPLLIYLQAHPAAELRVRQLAAPLTALAAGDWNPLLTNAGGSLGLFFLEGDSAWRYNLAGRPFLGPLMGVLFLAGLGVALWQAWPRRQARRWQIATGSFLALVWLLLGLAPVLITGPELSMTQAIGLQPVLYLFPALALAAIGRLALGGEPLAQRWWARLAVMLLFFGTAVFTMRDYFVTWANHPETRVQYETTMMAAMDYLNQYVDGAAAVSTITPGQFHTPALAAMRLRNPRVNVHWFDARSSLLLPDAPQSTLLLPGFTPLPAALQTYFGAADLTKTLPLRANDRDRPLEIYTLDQAAVQADWAGRFTPFEAQWAHGVALRGFDLQTPQAASGGVVRLVTWWQVERPLPDAVFFTHILGPDGAPIVQIDLLGAPGESWQSGAMFLQLHEIVLPEETTVGDYPLAIGIYTQNDGVRIPLIAPENANNVLTLTTVEVTP